MKHSSTTPSGEQSSRWKLAARALKHLALHAAICFVFALFLGWIEMQVYIAQQAPGSAHEFVGMYLVLAIYIMAPISCCLAAPFHLLVYMRKSGATRHVLSVLASIASSFVAAFAIYLLSKS
ncbi:hypothetical protein [Undibacterium sp. Xuan67W]|uniref:hypothetical protein n=1 Tax=Undibacterium sp. Xuan67W TaxID=3413057 RepID=UPI003BF150E1